MPSIFSLLEKIRTRPGMYLRYSTDDPGPRLLALELILWGYSHALRTHGIEELPADFLSALGAHLSTRHPDWSFSSGPISAIRDNSANDGEAWDAFWLAVDQLRNSHEVQSKRS